MKLFFYLTAVLCGYSYFIYPLILKWLPARRSRAVVDVPGAGESPKVSLIITVHNEQARIEEKLRNSLCIDYPRDSLEVIVASDCSTDATDSIVEAWDDERIRLVRADEHKGKEYAQLCAIREAGGDVIVFSDVATQIPADALLRLVESFKDPQVGALSSEDRFISADGKLAGEGAYVKYEMWLRRLESERAGLVGLSGSFFAARREVCEHWDIYSPSDFNTALNCSKLGLVAVTNPDVVGIYSDIKDSSKEYRRKVRTVIRGMTSIGRHPEVLNPFSMGLFAFQVWSHKIMRWGVPWFMLMFAVATLSLQGQGLVYSAALLAQLAFYGVGLAGWWSLQLRENTLVRIVFFFIQTNLALAQALIAYLFGRRMTVWAPSQR